MGETMVQDVAIITGALVLVLFMIYWATTFGMKVTGDIMTAAPRTVQDSLASHLTVASMASGNANITFKLSIPMPLSLKLDETHLTIASPKAFYPRSGEIERGGFELKSIGPLPYVRIKDAVVGLDTKGIENLFDEKYNEKIIIKKINKDLEIEIK